MSAGTTEIAKFHEFLGESLRQGSDFTTAEEALEAWRLIHPLEDDATEDLQQALAELAGGDVGLPVADFDRQFRIRHGMD
jgi:hypothetical protein